jgi:hypothetical protein
MTPRERLLTTLKGGTPDRVPLVLPGFDFTSPDVLEAHPDPLRREVARRVFDKTTYRLQVPSYINRYLITPPQRIHTTTHDIARGFQESRGIIDTPKGNLSFTTQRDPVSDTTWTLEYPVKNLDDIDRIASIPWELPEQLKPPDDDLPEDFAERGIRDTGISSPFVCVAGMMKFETFLELTLTEAVLMAELTGICQQRTLEILQVLFSKPGIEYVWIGGSEWVTPPMASPRTYDALVQEQERDLIAYAHGQGDVVVHVHCHGHVRHALQRTIQRGADYTEPLEPPPDGDITMAEAKALAAGRITLGGNVECRILCNETESAVETAVRAAFAGGKHRLVLRPTEGPSPRMSTHEFRNWMKMVDMWEALSSLNDGDTLGAF